MTGLIRPLLLMLALLLFGNVRGWAEVSTLTFTKACGGAGTADDGVAWTVTSDGSESNFDSAKGIHYGTGSASVQYIKLTTEGISGTITKVVVNASTASGVSATADVTVDGQAFGGNAQSLTSSATNYTFTGSASGKIVVTVTKPSSATKAIYVKSVAVTYSTVADNRTAVNMTGFTATSTALVKGNTTTTTVTNDQPGWTAAYTYASSNENVATVANDGVITAVGKGTAVITASLNVNPEDASYKAGNVTQKTVEITVSLPTHTATFSVNGQTTTQDFEEGAAITFPADPADVEGKTFVGWVASLIEGTTNTVPSFVTSETMGTADITYYACFAEADDTSAPSLTKMTSNDSFAEGDKIVIVAEDNVLGAAAMYQETVNNSYVNKYSFDNNAATVAADDKNWLTLTPGSNNTWKLGDSTNGYVYSGSSNNLVISATNSTNFTIAWNSTKSKFTIVGNSRWLSYRSDLDYQNRYFRMGGATTGNPLGVAYFDIYKYEAGSLTYSNYCTTVVADTREEAGIAFIGTTSEYTANLGEAFSNPELSAPQGVTITYSSSNTAVATVDASTGAVTLVAAGETTITASFAGNDEYKAGSASYTLTVESHEPSINAENIELAYDETSGEIAYTIDNPVTGNALTATSEVNWISNINVETDKVTFSTTANEDSEERTATITLTYGNASKSVTVTQAAFVADYATLPFSWEGGTSSELTALQGVTANGLGSDYAESNAPYLVKLDGTDDYIQVKTDSQPGVVTIDVKMIGGATTSSITVQESTDGATFTDVETLSIEGKQNAVLTLETTEAFQEASRYVRLSFTRGSNVGVGAISIAKYVPAIAVSETNIEATAAGREGTISVTYQNITEVTSEVFFCDAEGNSTTYDWITADFNSQDYTQLEYLIEPNDNSEARTAYMKVYALDDNANDVYSDVITVTQDGSVKYTLTIEPGQNCTLNVYTDPTSALQSGAKVLNGTTIYVNATAAEGFGTPTISVKNGDEDIELTYDSEAGAYYFTLESDVTISATAVEATTYALATGISTIGSGKHYIIVGNVNNDYFAMGTQNQNNRAAVSVTDNNGTISVSSQDVKEVVIVGPDKDSRYAIYDGTGYLYAASSSSNYLKTKEELDANGLWSISFDENTHAATITASGDKTHNKLRYNSQSTMFSCYESGQIAVYLYERVNDTPEATDVVSITRAGYATYCSEHALDFSNATGIKAYVGTLNGTELTFTPITKVPARTGVLLQSTGGTEVGATIIPITTTPSEVTNNCLTGVTAETNLSSEDYILNVKEAGAGFYKAGNYTTLGANRAYIAAQQGGQVKGFVINLNGDLPTGVAQMDGEKLNADDAAIFNLNGQRMSKLQKGVNIVNGKKVLVK